MNMSEKILKKSNRIASRRDQYTVVLEQLNSQFKAFGENLAGLRGKFEKFETRTEENFDIIKNYLFAISDRLDKIETDLKSIKAEMSQIDESEVDKKDFEFLKNKVLELEAELKRVAQWQKNYQKSAHV
ncbi:MAG: hypothetical protein PHF35_03790 [Candidatus Moranbacteria bacterium]|nr:hypothetical protein [Candidatus Moranbacteria bacterium]